MSIDPNDLLLGGGVPAAKFHTVGIVTRGIVEDAVVSQQTDMDRKPLFFDDGNPRMQVVVTLVTDERDASIENDDGRRKLYVKAEMQKAIGEALRAAGSGVRLEVGGTLAVQYTGDAKPKSAGINGAKLFKAQYKPPSTTAAAADLLDSTPPGNDAVMASTSADLL